MARSESIESNSRYANFTNAWAFARLKEAALYFEKAHILSDYLVADQSDLETLRRLPHKSDVDFPGFNFVAPGLFIVGAWITAMQTAALTKWLALQGKEMPGPPIPESHPHYALANAVWTHRLAIIAGITGGGAFVYPDTGAIEDPSADPSFLLTQLRLIDSSTLSWEQIIEIRADKENARKLRRLRLFLCDEYKDQDTERVRDDLMQRLEDYEDTARRLGVDMVDGSLAMLLGMTKEYALAGPLVLAAGLLDQLVAAVMTAAMPFVFQLGKVGLEIRRQRRALAFEGARNPVAFLHEVKRRSHAG